MVDAWRLPEGKEYSNFFNPARASTKENAVGWPKVPHHKDPARDRFMCIKYQVKGSCRVSCRLTHVVPSRMEGTTKATVGARFKEIFA